MMQRIADPKSAAAVLCAALVASYGVVPSAVVLMADGNQPYMGLLLAMLAVSCGSILLGFYTPVLDSRFDAGARRWPVDAALLHRAIWSAFVLFAAVAFLTAQDIPILKAISGAGSDEVSRSRGAFLKLRTGWEAALPYMETLLTGVLLPYSLGLLFISNDRLRWPAFGVFLLFTLSFMQKALFLRAVVPLFYLWSQKKIGTQATLVMSVAVGSTVGLPFIMTMLERGDHARGSAAAISKPPPAWPQDAPLSERLKIYLSAGYRPAGTIDHVLWRVAAVPIFTATDSLRVFDEVLGGRLQYGATSLLLSRIQGVEKVPFESLVYEHQWGKSDIGRSNAAFFIEAYVNFGWTGVVLFSLFVGQALRWFWKSSDHAFKALWLLFMSHMVWSGLLGTLLSNGYALLFLFAFLCTVSPRPGRTTRSKAVEAVASPSAR